MGLAILKKVFAGLAPIADVKMALCNVSDAKVLSDLHKRIEAARKYDRETAERRNYWGELAVWSERRLGELIIESKSQGVIGNAPKPDHKNSSSDTLSLLLGTSTEEQARQISSRAQKLAAVEKCVIEQAIEDLTSRNEEITKAAVRKQLAGAHVGFSCGENEWYTPAPYIEAAREVMRGIDLDPASSEVAQKVVQAGTYYTMDDDGLSKVWFGNVWMNPPYSKDLISRFTERMRLSYEDGQIAQSITLVNNATETTWFQQLASVASAFCFRSGRIRFCDATGEPAKSPLQGQCFIYLGASSKRFCTAFASFGLVCTRQITAGRLDS